MFATVDGISQRAPVHWSENVIGAALCFPYVVALDEEFITVHSMLDQQQKQTLPFKEGHILQDFEGIPKDAFFFCNSGTVSVWAQSLPFVLLKQNI